MWISLLHSSHTVTLASFQKMHCELVSILHKDTVIQYGIKNRPQESLISVCECCAVATGSI